MTARGDGRHTNQRLDYVLACILASGATQTDGPHLFGRVAPLNQIVSGLTGPDIWESNDDIRSLGLSLRGLSDWRVRRSRIKGGHFRKGNGRPSKRTARLMNAAHPRGTTIMIICRQFFRLAL